MSKRHDMCEGCLVNPAITRTDDDVTLCNECITEAAQAMTQEPYQPCAEKDRETCKRIPHQELLEQWANDQGFQTWSQDHAAVLRNLAAWLDKHTATLPESIGIEPCKICGSTGFHRADCVLFSYPCAICGGRISKRNEFDHVHKPLPIYIGKPLGTIETSGNFEAHCPHCLGSNGNHTSRCPVWRG